MEPREPPVVLILKPTAVAVAHHHEREHVFPGLQVGGEIEVGGKARILGEPEAGAVQVDKDHAFRRAQLQRDLSPTPSPRTAKAPAIDPRRVVLRNRRRRLREGHLHIRIMRGIETLKGPGARDREGRPAFIVIGGREHLLRHGLRAPVARKTPAPIETQGPGPKGRGLGPPRGIAGPPFHPGPGQIRRGRGPHDSAHGQAPLSHRFRIAPKRAAGGREARARVRRRPKHGRLQSPCGQKSWPRRRRL